MELVNKLVFKEIIHLKSVSDINPKVEKIIKKKFKYDFFYKNYKRIIEDNEIDVVLVLTSMNEHSKIAKEALFKQKHVLVEKPMAARVDEINQIELLSKEKGLVAMVGHTFLFNNAVRYVKTSSAYRFEFSKCNFMVCVCVWLRTYVARRFFLFAPVS